MSGALINKYRVERGLTLEQLGQQVGSSKAYMWQLENKEHPTPTVQLAIKIARALGVTVEQLFGGHSPTISGPAQEPDPLTSDFAIALERHRESIPVAIMNHIDQLQRQIDFSRGGKFGPLA